MIMNYDYDYDDDDDDDDEDDEDEDEDAEDEHEGEHEGEDEWWNWNLNMNMNMNMIWTSGFWPRFPKMFRENRFWGEPDIQFKQKAYTALLVDAGSIKSCVVRGWDAPWISLVKGC